MGIEYSSAGELLALLNARRISSVELLEQFVKAIESDDGKINAVVNRDFERAFEQAKAADEARGRSADTNSLGSLHGLPLTVKEAFDVEGLPTTWGLLSHKGNIAKQNAEAVDRLVDAGAIVFGKTNVPEALADCQSSNPLYGTTSNPWDHNLTCGGSSGGSAAALAAGFTSIELGSDLAGSMRTPAHFCGVFSHKPSYGLVSQIGHSLSPGITQPDLSVAGPMARGAADLSLTLGVLAGPTRLDAVGWSVKLADSRADNLADFRVAVLSDHKICDVDNDIVASIDGLAHSLRRAGAQVDENPPWPIDLELCYRDYMVMMRAVSLSQSPPDVLKRLSDEATSLREDDFSYRAAVRRAAGLSQHAWAARHRRRNDFRMAWQRFFQAYDVVLCPVHSSLAFRHSTTIAREDRTIEINGRQQDYNQYLFWAAIAGLSYLPSTVRPIGMARGLPVGVQIIGPYLEDLTAIRFAELLDDLCPTINYPLRGR